MILERKVWKEYHPNGQLWIVGEIGIVADMWKHMYDFRLGLIGYLGKPVCRLGIWKKYYDNGQIAWTIDFGDGTHEYKSKQTFPAFRKDGTSIP